MVERLTPPPFAFNSSSCFKSNESSMRICREVVKDTPGGVRAGDMVVEVGPTVSTRLLHRLLISVSVAFPTFKQAALFSMMHILLSTLCTRPFDILTSSTASILYWEILSSLDFCDNKASNHYQKAFMQWMMMDL